MNLSKSDLRAAASAARQVSDDFMSEAREYRDDFVRSPYFSPELVVDYVDSARYWRRLAWRLQRAGEEE